MVTGIQETQFDPRFQRERKWGGKQPLQDNSVDWQIREALGDKWVWLVTDAYLALPPECLDGFLREELV